MLAIVIESAFRSLALGAAIWAFLRILRIRNPHVVALAWKTMLVAALLMPLLMQWTTVSVPATGVSWSNFVSSGTAITAPSTLQWSTVLSWCYFVIAGGLLMKYIARFTAGWKIFRQARQIEDPSGQGLNVRVSRAVRTPATFGSTILVPEDFTQWDAIKKRAVILHERSHVENGDFYLQVAAQLHRIIFWFSPLGWWLPKQLALVAEELSDDAAVEDALDRATYADILLNIACRHSETPTALAMAQPANVAQRVERILKEKECLPRPGVLRRACAFVALAPAVIFAAGAGNSEVTVAAKEPTDIAANTVAPTGKLPMTIPVYPPESRVNREEGTVMLKLHILEDGTVSAARLEKSSGFSKLDESALSHVPNWRFNPGTVDGKPAAMWHVFRVTYRLDDAKPKSTSDSPKQPPEPDRGVPRTPQRSG